MKNPWRNPLKPLLGCAALLTVIGAFLYVNADHEEYYQSNDDSGARNDCSFTNEDYAFTLVYCGIEWKHTTKICNYYLSSQQQESCAQASSFRNTCGGHSSHLELIHVCYL